MEIRRFIWRETPMLLKDRVMRAYGALKYAAVLSSEEALNHISNIRLGLSLGILNQGLSTEKLNELMVSSQPGFLQQNSGRIMDSMERDEARAKLFNSIFKEG
jgi:protein arginine kinase